MAGKPVSVEQAVGNLIVILAREYIPRDLTAVVTASVQAEKAGNQNLAAQHFDHAMALTHLGVDCGAFTAGELYQIGGQALIDARQAT